MTAAHLPSRSFCLIRHGETTANADQIIAGITDVPLTRLGRHQAGLLSNRIWPESISLYVSPMSRAQHTARLAFPGRTFKLHGGLRERDWGVFEGQPLSEQPLGEDTPKRGESWPDMLMRVETTIIEICAASETMLPVLICHSGIIRAARTLWTTGNVGERPPNAIPLLFEKADNKIVEKTL